jgi:hypothetical protein
MFKVPILVVAFVKRFVGKVASRMLASASWTVQGRNLPDPAFVDLFLMQFL